MSPRPFFKVMAPVLAGAAVLGLAAWATMRAVETHPRITTTLLWKKDIAPILQRRCFSCHSPNNISMSFASFTEARPWAAAIREEILTRHMPPWSAVAGYGRFQNDPSLTQGEWDLLVAWVDGGAPSGQTLDEEQQPPVFAATSATWEHGNPDVVVQPAAAHAVTAGAADSVQRFEITTPFKTEQRVHGLAFKPGDRRVVRYAAVYETGTNRWLFSWTPWGTSMHLPEGVAFTLPANAKLSVEIGYRGTEEATTDTSEIGFYLGEQGTSGVAGGLSMQAAALELPAGAAPTRTRGELVLDETTAHLRHLAGTGARRGVARTHRVSSRRRCPAATVAA